MRNCYSYIDDYFKRTVRCELAVEANRWGGGGIKATGKLQNASGLTIPIVIRSWAFDPITTFIEDLSQGIGTFRLVFDDRTQVTKILHIKLVSFIEFSSPFKNGRLNSPVHFIVLKDSKVTIKLRDSYINSELNDKTFL